MPNLRSTKAYRISLDENLHNEVLMDHTGSIGLKFIKLISVIELLDKSSVRIEASTSMLYKCIDIEISSDYDPMLYLKSIFK